MRDGTGQYTIPVGTEGVTDTTIESAKYNNFVKDVEQDLNAARPIVAGGTGADNAIAARANLQAEVGSAQVVNYDSHVFENGSFWSANNAVGEPVDGGTFAGIAVVLNKDPNSIVIQAFDQVTGLSYTRTKLGGAWGAWAPDNKVMEDKKVNRAGDTMTGDLRISHASPFLTLNKASAANFAGVYGGNNNILRWRMDLGSGAAESGGDAGSDFQVVRYGDGGADLGWALHIARGTGRTSMRDAILNNLAVTDAGVISVGAYGHTIYRNGADGSLHIGGGQAKVQINAANTLHVANTSTGALWVQGGGTFGNDIGTTGTVHSAGINCSGSGTFTGNVSVTGAVYCNGIASRSSPTDGGYYFGDGTSRGLIYASSQFNFIGGPVVISSGTVANHAVNKGQLDAAIAAIPTGAYLPLTGGTMSGQINIGANGHIVARNPADGALYLGGGQAHVQINNPLYLPLGIVNNADATGHVSAGGNVTAGAEIVATGAISGRGLKSKPGSDGAATGNLINFHWTGSAVQLWTDAVNRGNLSVTSDYRVKKDVEGLSSTWARVKDLRPITYTHADYDDLFVGDDEERWGFIAHELQETLLPTAATGEKDAENLIQAPDVWPVLAAVTKALQEAMARIEALEGKLAGARG